MPTGVDCWFDLKFDAQKSSNKHVVIIASLSVKIAVNFELRPFS
jgi:hypothetical protein